MTKSIEEQANEAWNTVLEEHKFKDAFTHTRQLYYESGYLKGAKARDVQWLKVVSELRDALKFYAKGRVDHEPDRTPISMGRNAEYLISKQYGSVARESIAKADQLLKEMNIEKL